MLGYIHQLPYIIPYHIFYFKLHSGTIYSAKQYDHIHDLLDTALRQTINIFRERPA